MTGGGRILQQLGVKSLSATPTWAKVRAQLVLVTMPSVDILRGAGFLHSHAATDSLVRVPRAFAPPAPSTLLSMFANLNTQTPMLSLRRTNHLKGPFVCRPLSSLPFAWPSSFCPKLLSAPLPLPPQRPFSARAARAARGGGGTVVVVESPSKAAVVGGYLGPDYDVLASYGHVRDLAPQPGSVQPDADWAMTWAVPSKAQKCLNAIKRALKGKDVLVLASDPDREGEAIAWHLQETLRESGALGDVKVIRVAFNEITRDAVLAALASPRSVSQPLVEAYLARRCLDYVMGYGLSPVLWRKLPGSKSAGRVQSVALHLVTEREHAIRTFNRREYWSVEARLAGVGGDTFDAALTHLDGQKLGQFGLTTKEVAQVAAARVEAAQLTVAQVKRSQVERSPPPPFTTSTLQQAASAKLNFDSSYTMSLAQKLYEGAGMGAGLITYMRTDAVTLSKQAVSAIRTVVAQRYGAEYLPSNSRVYKSKAKNAQEAHEAIRPTDMSLLPSALSGKVDASLVRLYSLIWRRTAACQMASAVYAQLSVEVDSERRDLRLHAVASEVTFPGHLAVNSDPEVGARFASEAVPDVDEGGSGEEAEGEERGLERLTEGLMVAVGHVTPDQHFTQPPPRFTEGTLVKAMEEAGVGRPSTYSAVLRTLVDRKYVRKESRRLIPEMRGLLVSAFLQHYFPRYVDTGFTSQLEEQLDDVTTGSRAYKAVLAAFNDDLQSAISATSAISKQEVEDALEGRFGDWLFPQPSAPGVDPRACPACSDGQLELKLSKMGGFLGCNNYPDCTARFPLTFGSPLDMSQSARGPVLLGEDPDTGLAVTLRTGPYGPYLQLGEAQGKTKPKRSPLPKGVSDVTLAMAVRLLRLPAELGEHPTLGGPVLLKIGRFGPFVEHDVIAASLPQDADVFSYSLEEAVALLATKGKPAVRRGRPRTAIATTAETASTKRTRQSRAKGDKAAGGDALSAAEPSKPVRKKKKGTAANEAEVDAMTTEKSQESTGTKEQGAEEGVATKTKRVKKHAAAADKGPESEDVSEPSTKAKKKSVKAASKSSSDSEGPVEKRKGTEKKKPKESRIESEAGVVESAADPAASPRSTQVHDSELSSHDNGSSAEHTDASTSGSVAPGERPANRPRTRTPTERDADHAAGIFRAWELRKLGNRERLQQEALARLQERRRTDARASGRETDSDEGSPSRAAEILGGHRANEEQDEPQEQSVAKRQPPPMKRVRSVKSGEATKAVGRARSREQLEDRKGYAVAAGG